jgi:ring-1,2-phenylacetyl-CoA epoxidase subunit PaaD
MVKSASIDLEEVKNWLQEVKDPEIPVLSLLDMGVITKLELSETGKVTVHMTPTFVGCPAMDAMKKGVEEVLQKNGIQEKEVIISFEKPWTSDHLTEKGREALLKFGLAPPPLHGQVIELDILEHVECPYCKSKNTILKSPFGPTLCRSLHYCDNCKQAFEQFKPI